MIRAYKSRQVAGVRRQAKVLPTRERRPNPRAPLPPDIEAVAAEVRAAVVTRLDAVDLEAFPLVRIAQPIVRRRFEHLPEGLHGAVLAEVVEAVLADPVARLALREAGMHVS